MRFLTLAMTAFFAVAGRRAQDRCRPAQWKRGIGVAPGLPPKGQAKPGAGERHVEPSHRLLKFFGLGCFIHLLRDGIIWAAVEIDHPLGGVLEVWTDLAQGFVDPPVRPR